MNSFLRIMGFILGFTLLNACSSDTMPRYSILQGLRTVALILNTPEVNFDGTTFTPGSVTLSPTISDLYGEGRSLSYNLYWCLDPGIGLGAKPTCDQNGSLVSVASNQTIALPSGTYAAPNYTGTLSGITIDLSSLSPSLLALYSAKFSSLTAAQKYNGSAILIFFELYPTSNPSEKITSFKRLIFSGPTKASKNTNPAQLEIRLNDTEISALPTTQSSLNAYLPSSQAETYSILDETGTLTSALESLETAWFLSGPSDIECSKKKECTTDGTLALSRSVPGELNLFYPPQVATPTSRGRILLGVAKDDRGGAMLKRYVDGVGP